MMNTANSESAQPKDIPESAQPKDILALALYAVSFGVDEATEMAQQQGMVFNEEQALRAIAAYMGDDVAKGQRQIWDEARSGAFQKRIKKLMIREAAKLRRQHWCYEVCDTLQQLLRHDFTPPFLVPQLRGTSDNGERPVAPSPELAVVPVLDGHTLYMELMLKQGSGQTMPQSKDAVNVFLDGDPCDDLEFEWGNEQSINLKVAISEDFVKHAADTKVKARYGTALQAIDVMIGKDLD